MVTATVRMLSKAPDPALPRKGASCGKRTERQINLGMETGWSADQQRGAPGCIEMPTWEKAT
jgi:hypothetical protein